MFHNLAKFIFEAGILSKMQRSGFSNLGDVKQSIAEHSFNITIIAYCFSKLVSGIDEAKLIKMCLLHDLVEARTGDLNYVNKMYVKPDEEAALKAQAKNLPFAAEYIALMKEFAEAKTPEAKLAKDADQLELLFILKRASDLGHKDSEKWAVIARQRLMTDEGKKLAEALKQTPSDSWWFNNGENQSWWVNAGASE